MSRTRIPPHLVHAPEDRPDAIEAGEFLKIRAERGQLEHRLIEFIPLPAVIAICAEADALYLKEHGHEALMSQEDAQAAKAELASEEMPAECRQEMETFLDVATIPLNQLPTLPPAAQRLEDEHDARRICWLIANTWLSTLEGLRHDLPASEPLVLTPQLLPVREIGDLKPDLTRQGLHSWMQLFTHACLSELNPDFVPRVFDLFAAGIRTEIDRQPGGFQLYEGFMIRREGDGYVLVTGSPAVNA